jgi:hypothetical protein
MERNPWKLATIGMALVGTTALGTGLTTSYLARTPAPASAQDVTPSPRVVATPRALVATRPSVAPGPVVQVAPSAAPPRVTPVSTGTTVSADCTSGGDRAMRIAKPGAIGALIGAGLGAAGGAIADGGQAAGKGALIGGLAGAALGSGYGAYKTQNECGTILGGAGTGNALVGAAPAAFDGDRGQGITVYSAR